MASSNGAVDAIETQEEKKAETNALVNGLRPEPDDDEPADKSELLEQLTDSDLVTTDDALRNLATKDYPSANFSEEEATEFRHHSYVMLERKRAAYPHEGQELTGVLREWAHDDPDAGLQPVDKQDILTDETFKQGIAARITKGKQGSLIGLALRSIRESVLRRGDRGDGGDGILGRLRK